MGWGALGCAGSGGRGSLRGSSELCEGLLWPAVSVAASRAGWVVCVWRVQAAGSARMRASARMKSCCHGQRDGR